MPTRVFLFGTPRFERDGEALHIARRKSIALLAYLAVSAGPHSRDTLATMFWPEYDQSGARANLRRELSRIKSSLGGDPFEIQSEQVALKRGEDYWLDVEVFRNGLAASAHLVEPGNDQAGNSRMASIEQAVALYSGDFMAGFSLPDSPQFDDWQFFQSESLRRSLGEALQQLIRWKIILGEFERAIDDARRWLALDTLSEPAHRQLMQLYAWSGQQGAALRQYQECARVLKKEIGVTPEEETTALYESIKARKLPAPESMASFAELTESKQIVHTQIGSSAGSERSDNLPAQSTPFIGRERERSQVLKRLLDDPYCRLLTITGPGGAGKTRLAIEAATDAQQGFADGAFFVPLAALTSTEHILPELAESLRFRFHEASAQEQQLLDYLRDKHMLLVMDNFEHLQAGASLIASILHTAPGIKVLVTSRERLNLSDEVVIPLGGMQYPAWVKDRPLQVDLGEYDAVKLFIESARRIRPDFNLHDDDFNPIARLCSLVEGMPLAIILAAGWLEMLSLQEISEEIVRSLDFLESSAQDLPERQRSLRAVFNSSWALLDAQERHALARLTVFHGSFTHTAALAVSGASLKSLLALVQKAWLQRDKDGRLHMHELQRQYAHEILAKKDTSLHGAQDTHSTYYAARLAELSGTMRGSHYAVAYDEVAAEFENIRSAWHWLVKRKKFDVLVHDLLPTLYRYCEVRAKSSELLELVASALQALEGSPEATAHSTALTVLLTVQASFYQKGDPVRLDRYDVLLPPAYKENIDRVGSLIGDFENLAGMGLWGSLFAYLYGRFVDSQEGIQYLQQLIEYFRSVDFHWELAYTHEMLGCIYLVLAMYSTEREPHLENAGNNLREALEIFKRLGDEREQGYTLLWLGDYHFRSQRFEEAKASWHSAQEAFETGGDIISSIHWMVGNLLFTIGDYQAAFRYYHDIRETYIEQGHKRIAAYSLSIESIEALRYSDIEHALRTRQQSLELSQEVQDAFGEAWSTWEMGEILRVAGDTGAARSWYERARGIFEAVNEANGIIFYYRGLGDIAHSQGNYKEATRQFQLSLQLARQAEYEWGITYAFAGLAKAAIGLGDHQVARRHLVEGLQSAITTNDQGIALVVLTGWAQLFAVTGEQEEAAALCALISGHFAAWNETKAQVAVIMEGIQGLPAKKLAAAQKRGQQGALWEVARRLLGN